MIKLNELKKLMNIKDQDLNKFDLEQLRDLLGIFRYLVRVFEREINQRTFDMKTSVRIEDVKVIK